MTQDDPISRIVDLIPGMTVRDFAARLQVLEAEHGPDLDVSNGHGGFVIRTPGRVCDCITCVETDQTTLVRLTGNQMLGLRTQMIVCPECGNKRCPRATSHALACTRSNEPGQPGSAYGLPDPTVIDRIKGLDASTPDGRARIWAVLGIEPPSQEDAS